MSNEALLARLDERAVRVIREAPFVPAAKALLSVDGGTCPHDGTALGFDPWSPHRHRCPACGAQHEGERHHRAWARYQHLWLGERIAHLATLGALAGSRPASDRAVALLREYGNRYLQYPNVDNVLGPSRPFFSTYLESIWITNLVAGALLLRDAELLGDAEGTVDLIANESAALIGEFNEGFSNRQTWHNAALVALALWFEDEDLLRETLQGPTGLVAHLTHGFGSDGMWFEGENYHLFALRGLLIGLDLARGAGLDAFADPGLVPRLGAALRAPLVTALPDFTFPARKDARFGVSLAQPMYLELWEAGTALLPESGDLRASLQLLYAAPAPPARDFDSWLHEAGIEPPPRRTRSDLSWWVATLPVVEHDDPAAPWVPSSQLLAAQGLAILRTGNRYASLECGILGGGHGHPDRLHLTLHQDGVHWLPDPGTGSYVSRDLFWYRSTLAHNAPRLDGVSQPAGDAACTGFEAGEAWGWMQGAFGRMSRTVVSGPDHVLDIVELSSDEPHVVELPCHLAGEWEITSPGRWEAMDPALEFITAGARWRPAAEGAVCVRARAGEATLCLTLRGADEVVRLTGPGVPGAGHASFLLARATGRAVRLVSVLVRGGVPAGLTALGDLCTVEQGGTAWRHHPSAEGWVIESPVATVLLGGRRVVTVREKAAAERHSGAHAVAPWVGDDMASLLELEPQLVLDRDDQYHRSEEPWPEDASFSAAGWVGWHDDGLALVVEVTKPDTCFRPASAPPLRLDNEPDDIHSDGVEIFVQPSANGPVFGFLLVPGEAGRVRVRGAGQTQGEPQMVDATWEPLPGGYRVEARLNLPAWGNLAPGDAIGFDLLVNEMRPDRLRRAGQLVWSGDGGWAWLRGDRHDPAHFGTLELGA